VSSRFDRLCRGFFSGRKGLIDRVRSFRGKIGPQTEVIMFHVSSAGEFEQARPLIKLLKDRYPEIKVVVGFFSPSGIRFIESIRYSDADFIDFSPLDLYFQVKIYLNILRPSAVIFVRYDLWPNLILSAVSKKIKLFLIDACTHTQSASKFFVFRGMYKFLLSKFNRIMAISQRDAVSLQKLYGVVDSILHVTGDTKFDRVMDNKKLGENNNQNSYNFNRNKIYLIAGSTWPQDEECLYFAYQKLAVTYPDLQLIIVPHDITRISEITRQIESRDISFRYLHEFKQKDEISCEGIIVVKQLGILASLYKHASIAYVGGAVSGRVHNVAEPASMAVPVIFGSRYHNSKEAIGLVSRGGAISFSTKEEFVDELKTLLDNKIRLSEMGNYAYTFIESNCGAAERCFSIINEVI